MENTEFSQESLASIQNILMQIYFLKTGIFLLTKKLPEVSLGKAFPFVKRVAWYEFLSQCPKVGSNVIK